MIFLQLLLLFFLVPEIPGEITVLFFSFDWKHAYDDFVGCLLFNYYFIYFIENSKEKKSFA